METIDTILIVLVAVGVIFLFMLLVAVVRAGGCLQRVERLLTERETPLAAEPGVAAVDSRSASDSAFREFLSEDPERRKLPKREQFGAYRAWRKEKGLNWPQP
jgi:hypothetical protein